ncbi:hypothetical protein CBS101457_004024 [Exobasidium rhododendri]|nr:hypothetical protein CBS101457_004024 [Exobasidium rhododendri]
MEQHRNGSRELNKASTSKAAIVERRNVVHVEARLVARYDVNIGQIKSQILAFLETVPVLHCDTFVQGWQQLPVLQEYVDSVRICESSRQGNTSVETGKAELIVHAYIAAAQDDMDEMDLEGDEQGQDEVMAATVLELPNAALEGVWESLIYEDDVKSKLLNYISSTLIFSDAKVDFNLVSWNRLVLLHGPPGTGKTSLCRALAQKLAIRLSSRYTCGKLVEINSHSLFSKWFSESGKLVQKLFTMVTEMVEEEETLIVILIDEVESLTTARSSSLSGSEPGDAVRVVNALLTQLDKLKQKSNVLVMTTSNLSDSIDNAFMDRADIKQYIGPPPAEAIYSILRSSLLELMRVGIVEIEDIIPYRTALKSGGADGSSSALLASLAEQCKGFSGRTLRRLPVLAHARLHTYTSSAEVITCQDWLTGLQEAIEESSQAMQASI